MGRGHRGLCENPSTGWGKVLPQSSPLAPLSPSAHTQRGRPAAGREWAEGLLAPCQTYKRLYTVSDIKDFWLILSVFYSGSNSACIFHFIFILNYAMISGGKSSERIFFSLSQAVFCQRVIAVCKGEQPLRRSGCAKRSDSKDSWVVFFSLSPLRLLFYSCTGGVIK